MPVLICNPLALGTDDEGSPYERLRELLPLFASLDRDAARALIAINRWSVVDPICARGAARDEVISISVRARGEEPSQPRTVAREQVRAHCLDAEDGRAKGVRLTYLRYDTAIRAGVDVDAEASSLAYEFDDGPGAFSGNARYRFLDWVVGLVRWPRTRAMGSEAVGASASASASAIASASASASMAAAAGSGAGAVMTGAGMAGAAVAGARALGSIESARAGSAMAAGPAMAPLTGPAAAAAAAPTAPMARESTYASAAEIWSRPLDAPGPR